MENEWRKSAQEKLMELGSEACALYVKNFTLTEKEREAAIN